LTPDYKVLWNQGSEVNSWTILGESTQGLTTFTETSKIQAGLYYKFKVVAFNSIGEGPESTEITILAAIPPSGFAPP
jgi:hypothetical protein